MTPGRLAVRGLVFLGGVGNRKRCHSADIGGDCYLGAARRVVAPYGGLAAGTIQPGVAEAHGGVGRSRASDTLRRMSSWWSQCPWGKPRPYGGLSLPGGIYPAWAGVVTGFGPPGRRPLRWIAMPFTVHPAAAVVGAGIGRSRAPPLRRISQPHASGDSLYHHCHRAAGAA